ncbi:serine hydrolase domain-containing protein [Olleya sp. HaHaR_3_96]|uniref:serine hydrolase domain-containing protein n=1 Tax=Olleya sp. HaHaR_3_96 TaxID=2745560 RepID=UPI001C4E3844|nr:serine hydrolase domain-containing protein [Olleya sp. HaHaR_3_96]QXP61545.1 beta-lactamase family protein [Olleya sp. HaHaR_3_96]
MNKLKIIFGIILLLLFYIFYWTFEPYSLNPFSDKPVSLSQSENNLNCGKLNDFGFKADSIINSAIEKNDFLGISAGVYSENCGNWLSTSGFLNKRNQEKPNQFSKFRIASISKPMTAIAIFQLYEKRVIDLDIPIQNYLSEFPKKEKGDITIRQLLNHTSGISNYKSDLESVHFTHYANCIKALDKFKDRKLDFEPGSTFIYTSYGYTLLGAIIEKVTGQTYQNYMRKNIWEPSKMTHTDIENSDLDYKNKADVYIKLGNTFYRSPQNDLSHTYAGGGIQSTAEDMLKFGKAILNYQLISPKTTELMILLNNPKNKEREYTNGWFSWITPKYGKVIEHNGKQVGCSSFFRIFFDEKIVVVALANNTNSREEVRNLSIELSYLLLKMEND